MKGSCYDKENVMRNCKAAFALFVLSLFIITGCETPESAGSVSWIKVYQNGADISQGISIEQGQTVLLKADAGIDERFVSIVWENESPAVELISSGEGSECSIIGRELGSAEISVKAWRAGENPVELKVPVTVSEAVVTGITIAGAHTIGVSETQALAVQISPAWAQYAVVWSASPAGKVNLQENQGSWIIQGLEAGDVTLIGTANDSHGFEAEIPFTVLSPGELSSLAIYLDGTNVSGSTEFVPIGVFEEKFMNARIEPANAFTFFEWESSDPANVTVDSSGMIKGMTAASSATITVRAATSAAGGWLTAAVTVKVGNPVTGVRVRYNNDDNLQVSNIIWLYRGADSADSVNLQASLLPEGIEGEITWAGDPLFLDLVNNADGTCTISGKVASVFDAPPLIVKVSASNADNGAKPAVTTLQIKVLADEPLWAWDRARDADDNESLKLYGTTPGNGSNGQGGIPHIYENASQAGGGAYENDGGENTEWKISGRGVYADQMVNNLKRAAVVYTPSGLFFNSASAANGGHPNSTVNSTCLIIGSNSNDNTTGNTNSPSGELILGRHVPGIFDFFNERTRNYAVTDENDPDYWETRPITRPIRISVDVEVVQPSGRRFVIFVNNNFTATAANPLGQNARPLYRPITEATGSKLTLSATFVAHEFVAEQVPGYETLKQSLVSLVYESQGGKIYISGIRIEYGE